jgi:hypothetical protein
VIDSFFANLRKAVPSETEGDDLAAYLELARLFSIDVETLKADLAALVRERLLMALVGNVSTRLNFDERQRHLAYRLAQLSNSDGRYVPRPDAPEVIELAEIHQAIASALSESKDGIVSLDESAASDLLTTQGFRCAACGVPLRTHVRHKSALFADGYEPVAESAHLDHIVPHYFLGNVGGRRLLCSACYTLKNDRIGVQEDGFVVTGNHIRRKDQRAIRRRAAYWTLERVRRCEATGCCAGSAHSVLLVQRKTLTSPFAYGHLSVRCRDHAAADAFWVHDAT